MKKLLLLLLLCCSAAAQTNIRGGNGSFTGNVTIKGGTPWIDITAYGAKCDNGTTDNTAPLQNAWNAAKALGSGTFVYLPPCSGDYVYASPLNFSGSNGIRFGSLGGGTVTLGSPRIMYSGTTSPAINCATPFGVIFQNVAIMYNNAAFTGTLMDCTSTSPTGSYLKFDNVLLSGTNTAKLAANLLVTVLCQKCIIRDSSFAWAVNGINSNNGNAMTIEDSQFASAGPLSGTYLLNTTAGSRIMGNNFEFINAPNSSSAFDSSSAGCFGCFFGGNWSGDMPAGWTGTVIKGATGGMSFTGNTFQGVSTATMLAINGTQNGLFFGGNSVQGPWATVFSSNGPVANINIGGNQYSGAITTFYGGAGNIPSSGTVTDNAGVTTHYGTTMLSDVATAKLRFNDSTAGVDQKNWEFLNTSSSFIFRSINDAFNSTLGIFTVDRGTGTAINDFTLFPPFDLSEQGAPTGRAGVGRCYADSTSHTVKCSYNNGTFFNQTQTIGSGTAVMTTAGIATGACGTTVTVGATGVATTDIINISHNAAVTIGNGGGLTLNAWPTANNVNFNYCNSSAGTITPTAMTINWNVTR